MESTANVAIRRPRMQDGADIWKLVKAIGVLDVNSAYSYLMMCKFFPDTCAVAEQDDDIVGFVIGYRPPVDPDSLFIWQIGVDSSQRGKGLGGALIKELLARESSAGIHYITATISPSNLPSRKLFERLAQQFDTHLQASASQGMAKTDFPDGVHEAEHFYRVGPIR